MYSLLFVLLAWLLLAFASPATMADDRGLVLWDHNIASAVSADLPDEGKCSASPYAMYSPRCHETLNLSFDRPINYFSFLDRVALFLHKYHEIKYNQSLWDNTKLRFHVNLKNVYQQEARAGVELRIRFSSAPVRSSLLSGSARVAMAAPSVQQN